MTLRTFTIGVEPAERGFTAWAEEQGTAGAEGYGETIEEAVADAMRALLKDAGEGR